MILLDTVAAKLDPAERARAFSAWKAALWYAQEHDRTQRHLRWRTARALVDAGYPCTGVSASWCATCGDCTCPRDEEGCWMEPDPNCPLHAHDSPHAEGVTD